jgi:hypothetical protein
MNAADCDAPTVIALVMLPAIGFEPPPDAVVP